MLLILCDVMLHSICLKYMLAYVKIHVIPGNP